MKLKTRMFVLILFAFAMLPGLLCTVQAANAITKDPVLLVCSRLVYGDDDGEGWSYVSATNTLTLTDFVCTTSGGDGIIIPATRTTDLNIVLYGSSRIEEELYGIHGDDSYTGEIFISGTGSLKIQADTEGISNPKKITINGGTVDVSGGPAASAIYSQQGVAINGGTVIAAGNAGIDVFHGDLNISGGTVTASSNGSGTLDSGLLAREGVVTISGGTVEASGAYGVTAGAWLDVSGGTVTLIGTSQAINWKLKNSITGTGWTDEAGTTGKTSIATSVDGQNVYQYKKVVFPADEKVKVTFKVVNGAWNDGSTTEKTVTLDKGKSLTADQIPAVGNNPEPYYEAGIWDTVPDTAAAINSDTTFTYTYKPKDPVSVTVSADPAEGGRVTSDPADLTKVAQGKKVTLTANHNTGYVFDKWEVTSGAVTLSSETEETTFFTTGAQNVRITAHFKKAEPMTKPVEFVFVNKNTSKRGLPNNIKETTLNVKIEIKKGGKTVSSVTNFELTLNKETGSSLKQNITFTPGLPDFDSFDYTFNGAVSPAQLEEDVTSQDPNIKPKTYNLSVRTDAKIENNQKSILFYIDWDDGSSVAEPEVIKVTALPEDEIGAYKLRADGTKEYLIFHTYAVCMNWLGSDELCRGYERCFHKESPYVNPFVKP